MRSGHLPRVLARFAHCFHQPLVEVHDQFVLAEPTFPCFGDPGLVLLGSCMPKLTKLLRPCIDTVVREPCATSSPIFISNWMAQLSHSLESLHCFHFLRSSDSIAARLASRQFGMAWLGQLDRCDDVWMGFHFLFGRRFHVTRITGTVYAFYNGFRLLEIVLWGIFSLTDISTPSKEKALKGRSKELPPCSVCHCSGCTQRVWLDRAWRVLKPAPQNWHTWGFWSATTPPFRVRWIIAARSW